MSDDRLLTNGARLRANEVRAKIKELGFEHGVVFCLEELARRDGTLNQELETLGKGVMSLAENVSMLADVLGVHGDELIKLKTLDQQVAAIHPSEGH